LQTAVYPRRQLIKTSGDDCSSRHPTARRCWTKWRGRVAPSSERVSVFASRPRLDVHAVSCTLLFLGVVEAESEQSRTTAVNFSSSSCFFRSPTLAGSRCSTALEHTSTPTPTTTRMRTHARTRTYTRAQAHTTATRPLSLFPLPFEPAHRLQPLCRLPACRAELYSPSSPALARPPHPSFDCSNGCPAHAIVETLIDHIGVIFLRPLHRFLPPPITPPCFISTLQFPPSLPL
jgi:hypothetical protein